MTCCSIKQRVASPLHNLSTVNETSCNYTKVHDKIINNFNFSTKNNFL